MLSNNSALSDQFHLADFVGDSYFGEIHRHGCMSTVLSKSVHFGFGYKYNVDGEGPDEDNATATASRACAHVICTDTSSFTTLR